MRRMNAALLFLALLSSGCLTIQSHNSILDASVLAPLGSGAAAGVSLLSYLAIFLGGMAAATGLIWAGGRWRRRLADNEIRRLEKPPVEGSIGRDGATPVEPDVTAEQPDNTNFSATLR